MTHTQTRLRRGAALSAAAVALLVLALVGGAAGADTAEETEPATVGKQAYFTAPLHESVPPTLRNEFPPAIVCVVGAELCSEQFQPITGPISDAVRGVEIPAGPVQPVAPGTLPVGLLGGHTRYASYLDLELPPVPAGQMITRLDLVLHQDGVNWALESPAFRALLRALFAQYAAPSPDHFATFIEAVASGDESLLDREPTGVEICTVTEPWQAGENQDAAEQPARDCIAGANGVFDPDAGTWTFDLSFAADAWSSGLVEYHGLYLGPVGPPNVEYGDPDPTTNFTVSFAGADAEQGKRPAIRVAYGQAFESGSGGTAGPGFAGNGGASPGGLGMPGAGGIGNDGGTSVLPDVTGAPATDGGATVSDPATADGEPASSQTPRMPLRLWLLLPLGLSGAALFTRALDSRPETISAGGGVLERLTSD